MSDFFLKILSEICIRFYRKCIMFNRKWKMIVFTDTNSLFGVINDSKSSLMWSRIPISGAYCYYLEGSFFIITIRVNLRPKWCCDHIHQLELYFYFGGLPIVAFITCIFWSQVHVLTILVFPTAAIIKRQTISFANQKYKKISKHWKQGKI